jgi:hypothetical protein
MPGIIKKREANDKLKGFNLQRLRAIQLFFEELSKHPNTDIFIATEYKGDIYLRSDFTEYVEENKYYDLDRTFSFFDKEIRNTLVYFLEIWKKRDYKISKPPLTFGFYATNGYKIKKSLSDGVKKFGITVLPKTTVIKSIIDKGWKKTDVWEIIKKVIFQEYESQYKVDISGEVNDTILNIFIENITWYFQAPNVPMLEELIIQQIKDSAFYSNEVLYGRAKQIMIAINYELITREQAEYELSRLVTKNIIEIIFSKERTNRLEFNYIGTKPRKDQEEELVLNLYKRFQNLIKSFGEKYFVKQKGEKDI